MLLAATGISAALGEIADAIPALETLLEIRDLAVEDCVLTLLLGLVPVAILEMTKLIRRRLTSDRTGAESQV